MDYKRVFFSRLLIKSAALCLLIFIILFFSRNYFTDPLTQEERQWLDAHSHIIKMYNAPDYPPVQFVDKNNNSKGISVDFYRLIEEKLDFRFKSLPPESWQTAIEKLHNREIDITCQIMKHDSNNDSLLFSDVYMTIPSVIVSGSQTDGELSLKDLKGMVVAVVENSFTHKYLNKNYKDLNLLLKKDTSSCLHEVSTKRADAAVLSLSAVSYLIEKEKISNLKIAGKAGFEYEICFGIRNDWPVLKNIMDKGIKLVSAGEKHEIFEKWLGRNSIYFYNDPFFWMILSGGLFVLACFFLAVILWIYKLKKLIKEKNHSLKKQESHLRTVIRTIPDLIWLKDRNGVFINCNHMFEMFYGAKESELRGKTDFDFIDRNIAEKFVSADKAVIENMSPIIFEEEVTYALDGHKEQLETIKTPLIDDEGNLVGVLGVGRNITQRKKMEQELDKKTKELESILSNIQGITFRCKMDRNWSMIYMSSYAKKLTGYPASDFINNSKLSYDSIIYYEDRQLVADSVYYAVRKKEPWDIEYRIVNKDQNILWVHEKGSAVFDGNGNIDFLDGFIININDKKIFERHLIQSQKIEAIGALSGGIAHDFNNILTGIIGFAELLKDDLNDLDLDDKIKSRVEAILNGGFRASDLVSQILNFSRSEIDKTVPVQISGIIKEVAALIEPVAHSNIKIEKNVSTDSYVLGEPAKIHQILMNLCTNALYAMNEKGGILSLSVITSTVDSKKISADETELSDEYICISVKDSGCGMSEEIKKNIMTPFYTTKPKGIGTGMGLWVVEGIVKNMNGFIEIESEQGTGSEFRIYLPVFEQKSEPVLKYA